MSDCASPAPLETVELQTGPQPQAGVVWLHGVGADGHHFEYLVDQFTRRGDPPLRFVFPHAPVRAVTLCGGERMRAWYDLRNVDRQIDQDETAIRASFDAISALIERERQRGVRSDRLVLGGFSQGGAMALFTGTRCAQPLAGLIAVSCYRLLASSFARERQAANRNTPIFLAHGSADPVVPPSAAQDTRRQLESAGYRVEWHGYPVGHELCAPELADLTSFVRRVLSLDSAL